MDKISKTDRAQRRQKYIKDILPQELALLVRLDGVTFEAQEGGDRLVLTVKVHAKVARTVDYWPMRGYWRVRNGKAKGWRVGRLKNYFKLKLKEMGNGEEKTGRHDPGGADPRAPGDADSPEARDGDADGRDAGDR